MYAVLVVFAVAYVAIGLCLTYRAAVREDWAHTVRWRDPADWVVAVIIALAWPLWVFE